MKDDNFVLQIYRMFVKDTLPILNTVEDEEKRILGTMGLFNKKKCQLQIAHIYEGYYKLVHTAWAQLYSLDEEFDNTVKGISVLMQGKSLYAKTDVQKLVEQFFFTLSMVITPIMLHYNGQQKKAIADQQSDVARKMMHEMMEKIEQLSSSAFANATDQPKPKSPEPIVQSKSVSPTNNSTSQPHMAVIKAEKSPEEIAKIMNQLADCQRDAYKQFADYDVPVEELEISSTTHNILKKAGVKTISEICIADFSSVSEIITIRNIHEMFYRASRKIREVKKQEQIESGDSEKINTQKKSLKTEFEKLFNGIYPSIHQEVIELENDYEKMAMQINLFVDFSFYRTKWEAIYENTHTTREKLSHIWHEWKALDQKDLVKAIEYNILMPSHAWHWLSCLEEYSNNMRNLMGKLYAKAHGDDYSLEEYQKDLEEAEQNKGMTFRFFVRMEKQLDIIKK